ncbi:MAG: amidohydrolase family protein [Eubacteriales bacterium]|nr:amidohydrolase family protein [Eubacteriales bacterium]
MKLDFVIKNGRVVDPSREIDQVMDIAIRGNHIVDLPDDWECARVIDASGCYVFPGLIDYHAHVYGSGSNVGVHADYLLATGVTAAVDPGTAGSSNFGSFYGGTVVPSKVRIKSYLCMYGSGQIDYNIIEKFDRAEYRMDDIRRTVEAYRDNILGFKLRMSKGVATGIDAMDATRELADELGLGICVHTSNPVTPLKEVADRLKAGDIYCHCYHGWGDETILDDSGRVKDFVLAARERGVLMDAANGRMNFSIRVCRKALEQGFLPDIIASDWLDDKYNMSNTAKSLTFVMAKYLELGMPLAEVVRCVTETPAKAMKMEGKIGTLQAGAYADVAIFRMIDRTAVHRDCENEVFKTHRLLVPQMVFVDGEPAFCQADFALMD